MAGPATQRPRVPGVGRLGLTLFDAPLDLELSTVPEFAVGALRLGHSDTPGADDVHPHVVDVRWCFHRARGGAEREIRR
ncbi:MAG TPA: hypothetical protein PLI79_12455, partial [Mycobacterium sp.]|nr:hypothetical protein [Mycobacterium sp.]